MDLFYNYLSIVCIVCPIWSEHFKTKLVRLKKYNSTEPISIAFFSCTLRVLYPSHYNTHWTFWYHALRILNTKNRRWFLTEKRIWFYLIFLLTFIALIFASLKLLVDLLQLNFYRFHLLFLHLFGLNLLFFASPLTIVFSYSAAGCVPFSTSLISKYFDKAQRAAAIGFFYWGIFLGYSLSFVLIIAVEELGWRPVYLITGIPGECPGIRKPSSWPHADLIWVICSSWRGFV